MIHTLLVLLVSAAADQPPCPPPADATEAERETWDKGGEWVTNDDYPPSALRNEEQGITYFTLDVDTRGCVTACRVDASSGSHVLDDTTCALLMRRAHFRPAEDAKGRPLASTYSNQMHWQIRR